MKNPTYDQYMQLKLKYRNLKKAYDILREAVEIMDQIGDYAQDAICEADNKLKGVLTKQPKPVSSGK